MSLQKGFVALKTLTQSCPMVIFQFSSEAHLLTACNVFCAFVCVSCVTGLGQPKEQGALHHLFTCAFLEFRLVPTVAWYQVIVEPCEVSLNFPIVR